MDSWTLIWTSDHSNLFIIRNHSQSPLKRNPYRMLFLWIESLCTSNKLDFTFDFELVRVNLSNFWNRFVLFRKMKELTNRIPFLCPYIVWFFYIGYQDQTCLSKELRYRLDENEINYSTVYYGVIKDLRLMSEIKPPVPP